MKAESFYISRPNDPSLHFRQWGDGDHLCLLIHGFGEASYVWDQFAPVAAQHYRVLAIDLRGHGESAWDPSGLYDVQTYARDVSYLILSQRWRGIALIGHSLGGEIAMRVSYEHPDRVLGLVVADFGPDLDPTGTEQIYSEFLTSNRLYKSTEDYASWLGERRPLADRALLRSVAEGALRAQVGGSYRLRADPAIANRNRARTSERSPTVWALLKEMKWPTLIVRGIGSAILRQDVATRMTGILPNGELRSVPAAGHGVMIDNPEGFANAVCPFLLRLRKNAVSGQGKGT